MFSWGNSRNSHRACCVWLWHAELQQARLLGAQARESGGLELVRPGQCVSGVEEGAGVGDGVARGHEDQVGVTGVGRREKLFPLR